MNDEKYDASKENAKAVIQANEEAREDRYFENAD